MITNHVNDLPVESRIFIRVSRFDWLSTNSGDFYKGLLWVPDLTETGSINSKIENIKYLESVSDSTRISQYSPSCGHCNNGIPHAGGNTFERGSLNIFLSIKHSSSKYNHTKAKGKQNKSELRRRVLYRGTESLES